MNTNVHTSVGQTYADFEHKTGFFTLVRGRGGMFECLGAVRAPPGDGTVVLSVVRLAQPTP